MKDRFALRYRQGANEPKTTDGDDSSAKRLEGRRHSYLHDHRTRDALLDYIDDLET